MARRDTSRNIIDVYVKLLDTLECPVCYEYVSAPIWQCEAGHSLCSPCKNTLQNCPTCRCNFSMVRARNLEEITDIMLFPCKNGGCEKMLSLAELRHHEVMCTFSTRSVSNNPCARANALHYNILKCIEQDVAPFFITKQDTKTQSIQTDEVRWQCVQESSTMTDLILDKKLEGNLGETCGASDLIKKDDVYPKSGTLCLPARGISSETGSITLESALRSLTSSNKMKSTNKPLSAGAKSVHFGLSCNSRASLKLDKDRHVISETKTINNNLNKINLIPKNFTKKGKVDLTLSSFKPNPTSLLSSLNKSDNSSANIINTFDILQDNNNSSSKVDVGNPNKLLHSNEGVFQFRASNLHNESNKAQTKRKTFEVPPTTKFELSKIKSNVDSNTSIALGKLESSSSQHCTQPCSSQSIVSNPIQFRDVSFDDVSKAYNENNRVQTESKTIEVLPTSKPAESGLNVESIPSGAVENLGSTSSQHCIQPCSSQSIFSKPIQFIGVSFDDDSKAYNDNNRVQTEIKTIEVLSNSKPSGSGLNVESNSSGAVENLGSISSQLCTQPCSLQSIFSKPIQFIGVSFDDVSKAYNENNRVQTEIKTIEVLSTSKPAESGLNVESNSSVAVETLGSTSSQLCTQPCSSQSIFSKPLQFIGVSFDDVRKGHNENNRAQRVSTTFEVLPTSKPSGSGLNIDSNTTIGLGNLRSSSSQHCTQPSLPQTIFSKPIQFRGVSFEEVPKGYNENNRAQTESTTFDLLRTSKPSGSGLNVDSSTSIGLGNLGSSSSQLCTQTGLSQTIFPKPIQFRDVSFNEVPKGPNENNGAQMESTTFNALPTSKPSGSGLNVESNTSNALGNISSTSSRQSTQPCSAETMVICRTNTLPSNHFNPNWLDKKSSNCFSSNNFTLAHSVNNVCTSVQPNVASNNNSTDTFKSTSFHNECITTLNKKLEKLVFPHNNNSGSNSELNTYLANNICEPLSNLKLNNSTNNPNTTAIQSSNSGNTCSTSNSSNNFLEPTTSSDFNFNNKLLFTIGRGEKTNSESYPFRTIKKIHKLK